MKYCISCGSEYQDGAARCSDCADSELVTAEEMRRRGKLLPGERDTRRFACAGTSEDPLSVQRFENLLNAQDIPAFTRMRQGGNLDGLTTSHSWWEILVPEGLVERAAQFLEQERSRMEGESAEAARAAEEEAQTEPPAT